MFYSEACKKDGKSNTKSSRLQSRSHWENENIFSKNNPSTDKKYTNLNPDFEQRDVLVKSTIDDFTKSFHRFNYKCVLAAKINQATHGTTE